MAEITYGYVRVSTQEQNETRQLAAMRQGHIQHHNGSLPLLGDHAPLL